EASTIGVDSMSTMLAPATTAIASAPMDTQYGGSTCWGVRPWCSSRRTTNTAIPTYSTMPTDQVSTARIPSHRDSAGSAGWITDMVMARDWLATDHTNQVPLTRGSTEGRSG